VGYGFDAEDYYGTETTTMVADQAETRAIQTLQTALLPDCRPFTAASPLIGAEYEKNYSVTPEVILNVFPLSEAPRVPVDPGPISVERPARIYWFSQTIGPGRGLEAAVAVLGRLRTPVELHLRGFVAPVYRQKLQALAKVAGMARPIQFLAPASASEMVRLAADSDLGLSIEESEPLNRDLCLTNKVFAYLLAGLPQLLSPTSAQAALAPELGEAALLGSLGRSEDTARRLDTFFGDPTRRARSRQAAWHLGRQRYCWDLEKHTLLRSVATALNTPNPAHRRPKV
jgi:hypothetical protein